MVQKKVSAVRSKKSSAAQSLRPLQRFALFFFSRPRLTAFLALIIAGFGVLSYSTLLKREGFPPINIPYAIGQATYFVNDASKVDRELARPVSEYLMKQNDVKTVQTNSLGNFATVIVQYEEKTDAANRSRALQNAMVEQKILPAGANVKFQAAQFGFTERGDDAVVSFFSKNNAALPEPELVAAATRAAAFIRDQKLSLIKDASIISPIEQAQNPLTGEVQNVQSRFERFGERVDDKTSFYSSVPIGASIMKGGDVVEFGDQLQKAVDAYNGSSESTGYAMRVSASFAPSIRQQISELQKTLLEGLLAVLVIGSIVIAVRASVITVLSMVTVIFATLGVLELIGYTLNTISLFALILSLSLIVDDTIIVVEALDAQRKRKNDARDIVKTAIGKVGRAMIAATSTAALSFAPLLFVGGILGGFIRVMPITIISALLISLLVALVFIPFYARFIMLGKKHVGAKAEHELAADFEARVARWLAAPMLWAQHSKRKLFGVGLAAIVLSFVFIGAGGYLFQKVTFNIFPPSKDTNQIATTLRFPTGTTIARAEVINDAAMQKIKTVLGEDFVSGANYGIANAQSAQFFIDLKDYNKRKTTAPQYIDRLKAEFKDFKEAQFSVTTIDAGPPASDFTARVSADANRPAAEKLASDIAAYLRAADIRRIDDSKIKFETVLVDNADVLTRADSKAFIGITAKFVDTDTTALVTATQKAVEDTFTTEKVAGYGLPKDAVSFNFGQESENQDSFKTLAIAFPAVLLVIYLVLSVQFRSLLQPLLIFMAIPFSLFGITLGLWLTDNAFSFFAMLGFFALIGLSIKNTILLTDYANQSRRAGMNPVEAAHEALAERFRPLVATSLTAIVSIIPLALTSPFWQGLAVVLMFGLLSSTLMVVTVFPYYYLAGEFLRGVFRRRVSVPLKRRLRRA
ncbi:efflux RND transporter permease subunit [Candidatus Saccharibacteria bacterium]|nr:MAG: efflux RND transporter permease subunit [Candidatus Saccharibacteria bacterium]